MNIEIVTIDPIAVYWQKKENVEIQYWRYEKQQFKQLKYCRDWRRLWRVVFFYN
jgi:hypothetical protein